MESNQQPSQTTTLQWIFGIVPIILLIFQWVSSHTFFENQKEIIRFTAFFLLTIGSFLNYKQNTEPKNKSAHILVIVALGIATLLEINELTKLYF